MGADIQFPATSEPGALAWRDLVWAALGMLWGEEVGERAAGSGHPSYLLPEESVRRQPSPALTISEQTDPVLTVDFIFRTTSAKPWVSTKALL